MPMHKFFNYLERLAFKGDQVPRVYEESIGWNKHGHLPELP